MNDAGPSADALDCLYEQLLAQAGGDPSTLARSLILENAVLLRIVEHLREERPAEKGAAAEAPAGAPSDGLIGGPDRVDWRRTSRA